MKKYILAISVLIMLALSSCTNEDIRINSDVTFKIDPSTVIKPFTFQLQIGELETISSVYKLRIRLLIYNEEGYLVKEVTDYFSSYANIMTTSFDLESGNYKAVTISDIVSYDGSVSFEFWKLEDYNNLSNAQIKDCGYIGRASKILGTASYDFSVTGDRINEHKIDIQPSGAIIYVYYAGIHYFYDVERISLLSKKTQDGLYFDKQGNFLVNSLSDNDFKWRFDYIDVADYTDYNNVYSFGFALPMNNMTFMFQALTDDGELYNLSGDMLISPKVGEQYLFFINLAEDDFGIDYKIVNNASKVILPSYDYSSGKESSIYLKNIR